MALGAIALNSKNFTNIIYFRRISADHYIGINFNCIPLLGICPYYFKLTPFVCGVCSIRN